MSHRGGSRLEKSTVIDILTIAVLAYDGFMLYNSLGYSKEQVFTPFASLTVGAIQLTAVLVLVYFLEFLYDRARGSSGPLG
ncbi:MAG: hypothetical protein ABEJ64_04100 [Candidatus Nanohaloarchaea archaeon]